MEPEDVIADKAEKVNEALRVEFNLLNGKNEIAAEAIGHYLCNADNASKARFYDLLTGL